MARTLERARTFHMTGEVAAYDRILTTIGAVQPREVSGRAFALLAPERARTLFLDPLRKPSGRRRAWWGCRAATGTATTRTPR